MVREGTRNFLVKQGSPVYGPKAKKIIKYLHWGPDNIYKIKYIGIIFKMIAHLCIKWICGPQQIQAVPAGHSLISSVCQEDQNLLKLYYDKWQMQSAIIIFFNFIDLRATQTVMN